MSSAQTINAFLQQYLEDQCSGKRRTLDQYVELFPGDDAAIAERYARLESEASELTATGPVVERIGPYRVIEEIGRGGQGVVYLAEDERLHRTVALKVLTGLGSLASNRVARFLREAEIASRLDHPGIATVYEIGTGLRRSFIAMRYVEGETLAAQISRASEGGDQDPDAAMRRAAGIAEKAARALHAAHEPASSTATSSPATSWSQNDGDAGDPRLRAGPRRGRRPRDPDEDRRLLRDARVHVAGADRRRRPRSPTGARTSIRSASSLYECLTLRRPFDAPTRDGLYQAILTKDAPDRAAV